MEKVLILGIGKSGMSACKMLCGDKDVTVWDAKKEEELDAASVEALKNMGVKCFFAEKPEGRFDRVVISPGIRTDNEMVSLGDELIGELELAYEHCKGSFIAITGTNGKTTTTTLVGEMMQQAGIESVTAGNIGTPVCDYVGTTSDDTIVVTEVSSYQLETIKSFRPHISCILNLSPDHLERHGSVEEYYRCKARIFENQAEGDIFVYNADDAKTAEIAAGVSLPTKVMFTRKKPMLELAMEQNVAYTDGGMIIVRKDGKDFEIVRIEDIRLIGEHNIENVLAASTIALFAGVKPRTIAKVLKNFKGVEHRLEPVRELQGVTYINDSKGTNPDSTIKAVAAVNTPIILIAGGYEKNSDFHEMINSFGGKVKYMILLGKTADRIEKTAIECGFKDEDIVKCATLEMCVASAAKLAERGDTVLLSPACASWDMYKNFEERGEDFKRAVKSL